MVATDIQIMHNIKLCNSCVCSREIIYMFSVSQLFGHVKNFTKGILSDIVNVIKVKLCMMVLHIELYCSLLFQ